MKITTKTIRDLNPCVEGLDNFLGHYPEFEGTHEDFLSLEKISHEHKLGVLLRLIPRFYVEVFAIDCAARAANAVHASDYAANTIYHASDYAASAASAPYYAGHATERERQVDAICYLINESEKTK